MYIIYPRKTLKVKSCIIKRAEIKNGQNSQLIPKSQSNKEKEKQGKKMGKIENRKMVGWNSTIPIITLNLNSRKHTVEGRDCQKGMKKQQPLSAL